MHAYAKPTRFLAIAKPLTPWLLGVGLIFVLGGAWDGLAMVPGDYRQGENARFLYVHVPLPWLGIGDWSSLALYRMVNILWLHTLCGTAERANAVMWITLSAACPAHDCPRGNIP